MKTKYLKIAEACNMKDRIFFIESVPYQSLGSFSASADIGLSIIQPISKSYEHALPNKLFEYAVIGKPIVGGLSGYSKDFVLKNIPHGYIFNPGDVQGCINCLKRSTDIQVEQEDIQKFIKKCLYLVPHLTD